MTEVRTYKLFTQTTEAGADFLIRGKTGHRAMKLPAVKHLPDGSYLAHANGVAVRVIDAAVTITTEVGTRTSQYRYPSGVEQELWALLSTYQVLRNAMSDAILHRPDIDPDRLSFTTALRTARDQIIQAAGTIASSTIDLIGCIGTAVLADLLPKRRTRTRPRVLKRAISKYRAKGRDIDRCTYPATLRTKILTPAPEP